MSSQYKPVPDVEALRYKGTKDKPDIKIFVSHRIDLDSVTIDNPLYIPVRCGATFDDREDVEVLGDNTGDNISERRMSFCELTVQYWAWKNVKADYFGLCHYRRYISFSGNHFTNVDDHAEVVETSELSGEVAEKYGLTDQSSIASVIGKYDAVVIPYADVTKIPTPRGFQKNNYDFWENGCVYLIEPATLDKTLSIIETLHPEYIEAATEYLGQKYHRGYNTFILKRELFNQLCEFEFDVLFELEKQLDTTFYSDTRKRTFGFIGEILCAIFLYKLESDKAYSILEKQIIFFEDTKKKVVEYLQPAYDSNCVPVVFVSSAYYVPYLGVCIKSLLENLSAQFNYDIIVLHTEIGIEDQLRTIRLVEPVPNAHIRFLNPSNIIGKRTFYINNPAYTQAAYFKVLAPWILKNYSRAIVLDSDMIIKSDLAELLSIDWGENYIAAVRDIVFMGMINDAAEGWMEYAKDELKLTNPYNYFNAGLQVLCLDKIRQHYSLEYMIELLQKSKYRLVEQDFLNSFYQGNVYFLDCMWNLFSESNDWVKLCISAAPQKDNQAYRRQRNDAKVIHFANLPKPWENPTVDYGHEFWKVARQTEFYEELLCRLIDLKNTYLLSAQPSSASPVDYRTPARRTVDRFLPHGTRRRKFFSWLAPKGSRRRCFCKQVYYFFRPYHRPKK